jgi:hypothetical protein
MLQDADEIDYALIAYLAKRLQHQESAVGEAYSCQSKNVRTVLRRQYVNTVSPSEERPLCQILEPELLLTALSTLTTSLALFTLARVFDECHIHLCQRITRSRKNGNIDTSTYAQVDVTELSQQIYDLAEVVHSNIVVEHPTSNDSVAKAKWQRIMPMSFAHLPVLSSLADALPGESKSSREYAGIGGGGGSDIISASLLGHLLREHRKQMNVLISTRTWSTGSQGKKGAKLGVKREVYHHGGSARKDGRAVAGTFKVQADTTAEGRDLEAIPVGHHSQVFMVLDQGAAKPGTIADDDKANLTDQFQAVLGEAIPAIETVVVVDTGGDVFGADENGSSTPDQDYRVQSAISSLSHKYNLTTCVVAPGVDAPEDAPQKAFSSGGKVYKPSEHEKKMLLDLLATTYRMDGSDPQRFGKTTMALQACLRGCQGWTSLDLPTYVVDTWDNPWSSFVYIRECMSDLILMPTERLLPLIEPKGKS